VIRIAVSARACRAIKATLAAGSVVEIVFAEKVKESHA
jgi:hypothetical protein